MARDTPGTGPVVGMTGEDLEPRILAARQFNRFYTRQLGLLEDSYLDSALSLTQVRVLFELHQRGTTTSGELARDLGLDAGYLSRLLRGFTNLGLVQRTPSDVDGRRSILSLSPHGQDVFGPLDQRSHDDVGALLRRLSSPDQQRLVVAMGTIESLLGDRPQVRAPFVLRPPRAGDMGWVVARHGALYAQEYGWDETFEALVAEIVAGFIRTFDARRERCWIAETDDGNQGSIFCVRKTETEAQLRLLLVEPGARGLGIGRRLVDECVRFARSVGYLKVVLWTNDVLIAARKLYEATGFRLVEEDRHHSFGHDLVGQTWELVL